MRRSRSCQGLAVHSRGRLLLMSGMALFLAPGAASGQQDTTRSDPAGHPLITAARLGNTAEVEHLLAAGTDADLRPVHGLTPLMWAATLGDLRVARALADAGADPSYGYARDWTPISMAARGGALEVVRLLAARLPGEAGHQLTDALAAAAARGHPRTAAALIEAGAEVDGPGPDGSPPLVLAARYGRPVTVDRLLTLGARVDARDADGRTALMWASWQGSSGVAERLVAAGADPHAMDDSGYTALYGTGSWEWALEAMGSSWHRAEAAGPAASCPLPVSTGWAYAVDGSVETTAAQVENRPPFGATAWVLPYAFREASLEGLLAEVEDSEPDPVVPDAWRVVLRAPEPESLSAEVREGVTPYRGAMVLWSSEGPPPRPVRDPPPETLPWGTVPETIRMAADTDGDGRPDLLDLGTCCGDTTRSQDAAACEYMCSAILVRKEAGWTLCEWRTPA